MTALTDIDDTLINQFRCIEAQRFCTLSEAGEYIQFGQGCCRYLQWNQVFGQIRQQGIVEHFFSAQCACFGAQCFVFELFQFWGDKPLGVFECLAADILSWC